MRRLGLHVRVGISTFFVYSTLQEQGLHPYHIQHAYASSSQNRRKMNRLFWTLFGVPRLKYKLL
jgi:hypothetical protein